MIRFLVQKILWTALARTPDRRTARNVRTARQALRVARQLGK